MENCSETRVPFYQYCQSVYVKCLDNLEGHQSALATFRTRFVDTYEALQHADAPLGIQLHHDANLTASQQDYVTICLNAAYQRALRQNGIALPTSANTRA